ncbi:MAG: alanine racemase [Verrucomicrobiales bacterium]|jgi:alanine racemase|nr:alanine racemase [Verrucomicrobiales bacterium]
MKRTQLRCWCEIDLAAIDHNLRVIRRKVGPRAQLLCLVKANAYGHGLVPLARHFAAADCQMLGCANLPEALTLRQAGVRLPVLLLGAPLDPEVPAIVSGGFALTVSSLREARLIARVARAKKKIAAIHLKLDTGMHRLGADRDEFPALLEFCRREPWLAVGGVFSHLASAGEDAAFTRRQRQLFDRLAPRDLPRHLCNSAGILTDRGAALDLARPGILVYGAAPLPAAQKLFRPALTWQARVTFVKNLARGARVSYGGTFVAPRPLTVATVAVGYGDGLPRALSNRGAVIIGGRRCKILGRVTMDQIIVNVSGLRGVRNGSAAVLIGRQGRAQITANEMAGQAGTIAYEIFTRITERVPRIYRQGPGRR